MLGVYAHHKENLHGAYLAYTQGDAHENPKPEKGGGKTVRGERTQGRKENPGEEKKPGEETTPKKMPARAADTRPV